MLFVLILQINMSEQGLNLQSSLKPLEILSFFLYPSITKYTHQSKACCDIYAELHTIKTPIKYLHYSVMVKAKTS
jgi:hypothetical protein